MISFFVFLFFLFATYATYLLTTRKTAERRAQAGQRLADVMTFPGMGTGPVRLKRAPSTSPLPALDDLLKQWSVTAKLRQLIEQADLHLTVLQFCAFTLMAWLLGALMTSLFVSSTVLIALAGLLPAAVPLLHLLYKRKKRFDQFLRDLPDALELMGSALAAGHSFQMAMHMVATEMPEPVAGEFRQTFEEQKLGLEVASALDNLQARMPLLDLRIALVAVRIQRETGGNLAEILDKVATTIRERFRIMEDLKTLTMSSRISAWLLCALPVFIVLMITFINADYMSVLWHDPRGHKLLAVAVTLQVMGMLIVRRILNIKI